MTRYAGTRHTTGTVVTVNSHPLDPRFDLSHHSPDGFEWGYRGSGPAQLALALLADALGDADQAVRLHQDFKRAVVGSLDHDHWSLTEEQIRLAVQSLAGG